MNIKFYKELDFELKKYSQKPRLLAVTKYSEIDEINFAIENWVNLIWENRVETAEKKFSNLIWNPEKHFIWTVQTKKLRKIFNLFDVIQSIWSLKQLQKINSIAKEEWKLARIFLQFNISNEEQKSWFLESDISEILKFLWKNVEKYYYSLKDPSTVSLWQNNALECKFENIIIEWIMWMASKEDGDVVRVQFKNAKRIFDNLKKEIPSIKELSIWMSWDYEVALEEWSTIVRIWSALFP